MKEESHGFDRIDEYNSDKMVLDNLKKQMSDDATAKVDNQVIDLN